MYWPRATEGIAEPPPVPPVPPPPAPPPPVPPVPPPPDDVVPSGPPQPESIEISRDPRVIERVRWTSMVSVSFRVRRMQDSWHVFGGSDLGAYRLAPERPEELDQIIDVAVPERRRRLEHGI